MYTQHAIIKQPNDRIVPLEKVGPTVEVLAQDGNHKVTFRDASGDVDSLPSHEFFGTHREAYPAEREAFEKKAAAKAKAADAKEPAK